MKNFNLKIFGSLVVFSTVVFKQTSCSSIEDFSDNFKKGILNLLFPTTSYLVEDPNVEEESGYPNLVSPRGQLPFYKDKFRPWHNDPFGFTNTEKQIRPKENVRKGNAISWFNFNNGGDSDIASSTKKDFQFEVEHQRDQQSFENFGSEEDSGSDENYGDFYDDPGFPEKKRIDNVKPGFYGFNLGHNHGYHHHQNDFKVNQGFAPNHGFHHDHTPNCFPLGNIGGRPPRPRPPPPGPPPPSNPSPTIFPTTTNPPIVVPITAAPPTAPTANIDPRVTTSSEIPSIDIRFGRGSRSIRNEDSVIFPK